MSLTRLLNLGLLLLAQSATLVTRAHTVWIEPDAGGCLVIRFAEPGDDYETSPGHLDALSLPLAFVLGSATNGPVPMDTRKQTDHFSLAQLPATNRVLVESAFTVRGGRKPLFYARWQPSLRGTGEPLLTFDLVPTGTGDGVRAWFRGEPLRGVKATLRTPDGKERPVEPDADGVFQLPALSSGLHLLSIAHYREPVAGFHLGRRYEQTSHNCCLTWYQP